MAHVSSYEMRDVVLQARSRCNVTSTPSGSKVEAPSSILEPFMISPSAVLVQKAITNTFAHA